MSTGEVQLRRLSTQEKLRSQEMFWDASPCSTVQGGWGLTSLRMGQTESSPHSTPRTPDSTLHGAVLSGNVCNIRTVPESSALMPSDMWKREQSQREGR